jgi:hypothetical protein
MASELNMLPAATYSDWKPLYKLGAVVALLMVGIIVAQFISFMTVPPPLDGDAADWFELFAQNPLMGLVGFELLMVVYVIISLPLTLALYVTLRHTSPSWMLVYLALSLVGVMSFIAARPAFEMLALSQSYAAAGTDAGKSILLAAGEATLATFHGLAFHVSYVLGSLTGLILSLVMLRDRTFGKATAWLRIGSSIFDFGLYLPGIGIYVSIFSVFFLLAWDILVARRFLQLSSLPGGAHGEQA